MIKGYSREPRPCWLYHCGLVPYPLAWDWQKQLLQQRIEQPHQPDILLLLEHFPVYTLGQGATPEYLKFDPQQATDQLYRVERGGEVTYHCPGQLVGYPILQLRHYQPDLHWYLRQLEAVILLTLSALGLKGERIPGLTGVWLEGAKVAALGIKVSRWVTMHGFALNVCPDLTGFEKIVPCGIGDRPVGSLAQFLPGLTLTEVTPLLIAAFAEVFRVQFVPQSGWPVAD